MFMREEAFETGRNEAIVIVLLTSCATAARRRRGAGKALARRFHWAPQPRALHSGSGNIACHVGEAAQLRSRTRDETPVRQGIRAGLAPPLCIEIFIQAG
jgi:hypothetical protein